MTALNRNDLDWFAARLAIAVYDTNKETPEMSAQELKEALKGIKGAEDLTIGYARNGNQIVHVGDITLEVGPMASNDEIRLALSNPTVRTENTKVIAVSAIDRIKAKALQAKQIVPNAIKSVEADLDGIIAEKSVLDQKRADATAPHLEAIAGIKSELDGIKSALDILSNGGPPLDESKTSAQGS